MHWGYHSLALSARLWYLWCISNGDTTVIPCPSMHWQKQQSYIEVTDVAAHLSPCFQPLCQHYHDLATAYCTNNPGELRNVITKHTETYNRVRGKSHVNFMVDQCFGRWIPLFKLRTISVGSQVTFGGFFNLSVSLMWVSLLLSLVIKLQVCIIFRLLLSNIFHTGSGFFSGQKPGSGEAVYDFTVQEEHPTTN